MNNEINDMRKQKNFQELHSQNTKKPKQKKNF